MGPAPVFPVIMCGGSGVRLWPASRPWRPKQFIPLVGARSSFQETALRVAPLADGGALVVVAGVAHRDLIAEQLAAIGVEATLLLEPEPRESAAAVAAACAWIEGQSPGAVALIVSADHHIPDAAAFRDAARQTYAAAEAGGIVTFGVRPTHPETAYGYIRSAPGPDLVKPVEAFVEKPAAEVARLYVDQGYLWNSGNFIARAATLLGELDAFAPRVAEAARTAVAGADGAVLGDAFRGAPKTSIDYAVMEKTRRAMVLPAAFAWSDLGAWQAVWAASDRDTNGNVLTSQAEALGSHNVLVSAPAGVEVAVVGASDLAVVVSDAAVLVCAMARSQDVKQLGAASDLRSRPRRFRDLAAANVAYDLWLRTAALPLWATVGVEPQSGAFREALTPDGLAVDPYRRGRVQSRQTYVYASAAKAGIDGPWRAVAERGFDWYVRHGRRPDGLFADRLDASGAVIDPTANVYEQAFALLAMSALGARLEECALAVLGGLQALAHPAGGYREASGQPFQANCHMHLLEACLAWEAAGTAPAWRGTADAIVELALSRFMVDGRLHEAFDADWRPLTGDADLLEPGHHFEWAWLLERWGAARGHAAARAAARKLFEVGVQGVDPRRGVAINSIAPDLSARDRAARLWPQTEYLKAALILGEGDHALAACEALALYLETPARGAWRDVVRPDGGFVEGPAPASSFYHIVAGLMELSRAVGG